LSLQQNLQQGLDRDEFGVVYQPVVELATGRVLGAEALVRWNTDEFGTLLPQEFLPLFAEGGLMEDLGNVVFQKAVADLAGLAEFEGFLSVNLSREELVSPDLLQRLNHMLATHEVPTERIRLEMTERDVLNQRIRSTMSTASEMGFGICIEDFGTGPTSLRHLAEFTGLSLKMDRSFLRSFGRDKSDQVILRAVTDLADELGFVVGVEAVTSVQQRDSVLRLGVTQAQGWYFGRPGNLSEAARLAATVPETSSQTDQAPS
jgi:EAL domain-containing protein (putative c-di-GMP-specific phosphodiesterase class I)